MRRRLSLLAWVGLAACADVDGDGYGASRDCDDANAAISPANPEVCDGKDNDCNGQIDEDVAMVAYQDRDGDGFGDKDRARRVCKLPADGVTNADDCDDLSAAAAPGGAEACDGRDNDCDGEVDEGVSLTWYRDQDGDGFGVGGETTGGCTVPSGYAVADGDCDDTNALAWTSAAEACDGADNDCNGAVDEGLALVDLFIDADGDGHGDAAAPALACGPVPGFSADGLDCADDDAAHGPDTPESDATPGDDDCDGYAGELEVPTAFPTVAAAIAAAADGDVIQVVGLHEEDVELPAGRDLTLAGEGCGRSVLTGTASGPVVRAEGGTVADLTLTGGSEGALRVDGDVAGRGLCVQHNYNWDHGGGVVVVSGTLVLDDSVISDNTSFFDGGGTAVLIGGGLVAHRVTWRDNYADGLGGALNVRSGDVNVYASVFAANMADDTASAVSVRRKIDQLNSQGSTTLFENCTFDGNVTRQDEPGYEETGYVISAEWAHCRAEEPDCTPNSVTVRNSLFTHHTSDGNAITFIADPASNITLAHNAYFDNGARDDRYGWSEDAVRGDPALVRDAGAAAGWDLRPGPGSILIGAGDPARLNPDGSRSDIGAYGGPFAPDDFDAGRSGDADGDGMIDRAEAAWGLSVARDDADADPDADGLSNADELAARTDPFAADFDGDGVDDGDEVAAGSDPRLAADEAPWPAIAAPDRWVVGEALPLDGAASFDPDGDPIALQWSVEPPAGAGAGVLTGSTDAAASLVPTALGVWTVHLRVDAGGVWREAVWPIDVVDAVIVPDDSDTLAQALSLAAVRQVPVALRAGVYAGSVSVTDDDVDVFGIDDAGAVILEGSGGSVLSLTDAGYAAAPTSVAPSGHRAVLRRLTLRGGSARFGGGLSCVGYGVELHDVHVEDNEASCHGGGLFFDMCTLSATDLVVDRNAVTATGLLNTLTCDVPCIGNDVNQAQGGGIFAACSTLDITRGALRENAGAVNGGGIRFSNAGGYFTTDDQELNLDNVVFAANTATNGAGLWIKNESDPDRPSTFRNVVFVDHSGSTSTATFQSGRSYLINTTFAYNSTDWIVDEGSILDQGVVIGRISDVDILYTNGFSNTPGTAFWRQRTVAPAPFLSLNPRFLAWSDDGEAGNDVLTSRPDAAVFDQGMPEPYDLDGSTEDLTLAGGPGASPTWRVDSVDSDGDGMSDGWELRFGLVVGVDDSTLDHDHDGRTNLAEYTANTAP